ncbi:hypothetical protein ACFSUD_07425 [Sulfitobacter aestuarii]|uniref:Antifreeze glycopeptide polyprotein n=1 Tax=Sulfitobacter aestuarii TaxID=2161676 RepID=A0ABW5U2K5_9RHOB
MRTAKGCLSAVALSAVLAAPGQAEIDDAPPSRAPLSVIDWLGSNTAPSEPQPVAVPRPGPPQARRPRPDDQPPVVKSALAPQITVTPLGKGQPREIGLVPGKVTGLPASLWRGSEIDDLLRLIERLPDLSLPAAQSLLYTVLLAEARAPQGKAADGDALARARVRKLAQLGALDPALSLIEQAGVATSPEHFDLWMQISLLNGTEDRACATLKKSPHLTRDYGTRIFCAARDGEWENAALTFGSAQALGLMNETTLALFDRFLHPDLFEGAAPLPVPRDMDPMSFRLFETIGEPLPTRNLPRAYAVADLRDLAGWKSQLEAAERLTRAGALPDNHLLGLYTARDPAASGGIWDRVAALQRFETALASGDPEQIAKALDRAWEAMREAELEIAFATLFAEKLQQVALTGRARGLAFAIGLLSPAYEATATQTDPLPDYAGHDGAFLRAVALGEAPARRPGDDLAAAIHDAFTTPEPRTDLLAGARSEQLGASILRVLALLDDGARGDAPALGSALATLRALGLEDTARRAALQVLLLRPET